MQPVTNTYYADLDNALGSEITKLNIFKNTLQTSIKSVSENNLDALEQNYRAYLNLVSEGTKVKLYKIDISDPTVFKILFLYDQILAKKGDIELIFQKSWAKELSSFVPRIEFVLDKTLSMVCQSIRTFRMNGCLKAKAVNQNFKQINIFLKVLKLNVSSISERLNLACKGILNDPFHELEEYHKKSLKTDLKSLFQFTVQLKDTVLACRLDAIEEHQYTFALPYNSDSEEPFHLSRILTESKALLQFCQKYNDKRKILLSFHILKKNLKYLDAFFIFSVFRTLFPLSPLFQSQFKGELLQYMKLKKAYAELKDIDQLPFTIDLHNPWVQGDIEIETDQDFIGLMDAYNESADTLEDILDKTCSLSTTLKYLECRDFVPHFLQRKSVDQ